MIYFPKLKLLSMSLKYDNPIYFIQCNKMDLTNNHLTTLPKTLSHFQSLIKLSISHNAFKSYDQVAKSLSTLPQLQILDIDLSTHDHAVQILKTLPKLLILNNNPTKDQEDSPITNTNENDLLQDKTFNQNVHSDLLIKNQKALIDIDEEDLDLFSINNEIENFNQINEMIKKSKTVNVIQFNKLFQVKLQEQIAIINQCLDMPNYEYAMIITKAKIDVYNFLFDYVLEIITMIREPIGNSIVDLCMISGIIRKNIARNNNCLYTIIKQLKGKIEYWQDDHQINPKNENENDNSNYNDNEITTSDINYTTNQKKCLNKKITKHQLNSIMHEVIQGKESYDKRCNNEFSKQNKSTMKQFLISYLMKKYGLKKITSELYNGIMSAIEQHSENDSEICLFGKILSNDIEEESIIIFKELKKTINELLSYYYMKKYPYKSTFAVESLSKSKQNYYLNLDEWKTILTSIFTDSDVVLDRMLEYIITKNKTDEIYMEMNCPKIDNNHRYTKDEMKEVNYESMNIMYSDFVKVLLAYQIKLREKYLQPFVKVFKEKDDDNDGILDEIQFSLLIKDLEVFEHDVVNEKVDQLLKGIDPYKGNRITFSDCVAYLGKQLYNKETNCSIMDQINMISLGGGVTHLQQQQFFR